MRSEFDALTIEKSCHGQNSISIENPSKTERTIIRNIIANNFMDTEEYKIRSNAKSFLQCDYPDYILVEFWTNNMDYINAFINMVNEKFAYKKGI